MTFRLWVMAAVMVLAAMGDGDQAPPPPAALPPGAAVPGAGLNRPGTRGVADVDVVAPGTVAQPAVRLLSAAEVQPDAFLWRERVIVVFADTVEDPAFVRQVQALMAQPAILSARDVVVVTDADPAASTVWRQRLRPEGFSLVILDKDGQLKTRKPLPWTVREIARAIDKFPSRLEEVGRSGAVM